MKIKEFKDKINKKYLQGKSELTKMVFEIMFPESLFELLISLVPLIIMLIGIMVLYFFPPGQAIFIFFALVGGIVCIT